MRDDIQTVLFDLDGTLIDHFQCIYRCFVFAGETLGKPIPDYATVRATVGGSALITAGKLYGQENAERAESLFREHFNEIMLEDLHVLPGVEWLLDELPARGLRPAVFTNKHGESARKIMRSLGLADKFDAIIGSYDTPWRKPQPEFTRYAVEQVGGAPETTILVGDSPFDIQAARAGDLRAYVVATGSHNESELAACDPAADGVFPDLFAFGVDVLGLTPKAEV